MTPGGIAILSTCGLILVTLIGAIVELRKTGAATRNVEHEVSQNTGGSLRDAVDGATKATGAIGQKLDKLHDLVHLMDTRLTRVETRTEMIVPRQREEWSHGE